MNANDPPMYIGGFIRLGDGVSARIKVSMNHKLSEEFNAPELFASFWFQKEEENTEGRKKIKKPPTLPAGRQGENRQNQLQVIYSDDWVVLLSYQSSEYYIT